MRIEIRADSVRLDGYVNVPGRESKVLTSASGKFIETIQPQAFQRALDRSDDTPVLFNHLDSRKLGSRKEGNVELREDSIGLRCTLTTNDPGVMEKAKKGELRGWSFGFVSIRQDWSEPDEQGIRRRSIADLDLREVSLLDKAPAYNATSVEMRDDGLIETRYAEPTNVETVETEPEKAEQRDEGDKTPAYINQYKNIIEMMRKR